HTPEVTWYGWDGDRLTTTETATQRVQTIYTPGSFTPLIRVETQTAELAKAVRRTLAEKFQQEANVTFPPELVAMVDSLEAELQRGELSAVNRAWLAQCGLTPEQIQNQMEPEYTPERKIHLYHCDHRGLPLALVNAEGKTDWSAEYDAWGNVQRENNPHNLQQLIRLPGQHYDEETGLYYNRHRYYDPLQGRYITQDPVGLRGGWNFYTYPLNPVAEVDPQGLMALGGEFGKWAGSAANAASEGHMSYDNAAAAIDAANGPTYLPPSGSLSVDIGGALDAFSGGSFTAGIAIGTNNKASGNQDICVYYMLCEHSGIGYAAGLSISGTVSGGGISPGKTESEGMLYSGGLLGKFSVSGAKDTSGNYSGTLSAGPGIGVYGGRLTCSQISRCISELMG
ncbi:RHS repeat protein, partial [Salmonella enterica]|nr:RHS repeat protein [Salmonella enterica]EHK5058949.1 RHS repeat protein [Salmonella enterica]EJF0647659.1 RHS repeat protein [Salmonella enterica]ELX9058821.1 RHS repeat protein [Salmonella enterica]